MLFFVRPQMGLARLLPFKDVVGLLGHVVDLEALDVIRLVDKIILRGERRRDEGEGLLVRVGRRASMFYKETSYNRAGGRR
jgi:hypothetical protein